MNQSLSLSTENLKMLVLLRQTENFDAVAPLDEEGDHIT